MTVSESRDAVSASKAIDGDLYDYVVVGAGSAGCVLASRLSEEADVKVLLLDVGPDPYNGECDAQIMERLEQPIHFQELQDTDVDWRYFTEPQPHLNNRQIFTPRGKLVGGTGTFAAGLYVRGNAHDYDEWEKLGNPGWSFKDVLPYFKKGEDNHVEGLDPSVHGKQGPVAVSDGKPINAATEVFLKVCEKYGYRRTNDLNNPEQEGVGTYQVLLKDGRRVTPLNAYLTAEVRQRPNLQIKSFCQATKLRIEGGRAVGVEYQDSSHRHHVSAGLARARNEVIVSCGAIDSPKLLLLSGIGPKQDLERYGIEVVADLPGVGKNYHDHPIIGLLFSYKGGVKSEPPAGYGIEGGFFERSSAETEFPDLQFVFCHMLVGPPGPIYPDGFMLVPTLVEPHSRGDVSLRSVYLHDPPHIQPNFLAQPEDLERLVTGVKKALTIVYDEGFDDIRGEPLGPGQPGQNANDETIKKYIQENAATLYHPAGTCRMGPNPQDAQAPAVVDAHLKVHQIQGLRVVDASVMPRIVRGNPQTPTLMIAEKAADMIKADQYDLPGFTINAWLTVLDGKVEEFKRLQSEYCVIRQKDLWYFQISSDPTDERRFLWSQVWKSEAALEASRETKLHKEFFLGKIGAVIGPPTELRPWRPN